MHLGLYSSAVRAVRRYSFETVHPTAKQNSLPIDIFLYGHEPFGLLLWLGDLKTARTGWAKIVDGHKRILASVQNGTATVDSCAEANAFKPSSLRPPLYVP